MSTYDFSFLEELGADQKHNLCPAELIEEVLHRKEGRLSQTGAVVCNTGRFTGRSPKDRFFVKESATQDDIWWGNVNQSIEEEKFDGILAKMQRHLQEKVLYVRDARLGAQTSTSISLRVYNTEAWHNLFCHNMFLRVRDPQSLHDFLPQFAIICAPDFVGDPAVDGIRSENFVLVHLSRGLVLIGGTGYAGEMKKSMFTIMNYLLPVRHGVLPMHCSANVGKDDQTALFFGLSGTGKTTLSADPERRLIGDDEHGWSDKIFNFEGGCYAKTINLSPKHEPDIFHAIRFGAIVENTPFIADTRSIDYSDSSITDNTRTAYPIGHISNAVVPSIGSAPKHIFFLTADAFGVLPPLSKLTTVQAMYHFISGYTAKVAGTEAGVTEPQTVFSACFGAPFLPLHPVRYARMLGEKLEANDVQVWWLNTGWNGGPYGVGERISLPYTRALIQAVLGDAFSNLRFEQHDIFGVSMPVSCPGVPDRLLDPQKLWKDEQEYLKAAKQLAVAFRDNFAQYSGHGGDAFLEGAPRG